MEPALVDRVLKLRTLEEPYWHDELFSLEALINPQYRELLLDEIGKLFYKEEPVATKQAKTLPAWAHIDNEEQPVPAFAKAFVPKGQIFVDPVDGAAYEADGEGRFVGDKIVREHPKHTLLRVVANAGTYWDFRTFYERDVVPAGKHLKQERKLNFIWFLDEFVRAGGKFERHEAACSREHIVVSKLVDFNDQVFQKMKEALTGTVQKIEQDKEALKQARREDREYMKTIEQREREMAIEKQKADELHSKWAELYSKVETAGLGERFSPMWLELPHPDPKQPVLTAEMLALLAERIDALLAEQKPAESAAPENDVIKGDDTPQETPEQTWTDDDGVVRTLDGEIIFMPAEMWAELVSDAPGVVDRQEKFTINSKERANWYTRKVRQCQIEIENIKNELKERKNSAAAICSRVERNLAGLKWGLGLSMKEWFIEEAKKEKKQSVHLIDGTIKAKQTGGLICSDPAKFASWIAEMSDPEQEMERQLYGFTESVTYNITEERIRANLAEGLDLPPGWEAKEIDKFGDFNITAPPKPRAKKGAVDQEDEAA